MRTDWVAASVRARALARRRAGPPLVRRVAAQDGLEPALALLASSVHGRRLEALPAAPTLAQAQRATRETVLWQLRVLAGWTPARGTTTMRALASGFERDNVLGLARRLQGRPAPEPFDLGALATAWPRLREATSTEDLLAAVRRSPWGDPGHELADLPDVLAVVRCRAVAAAAPQARTWAGSAAAVTCARALLLDGLAPERLREVARPLLGRAWETTTDVAGFRAALPTALRPVLDGVAEPAGLWRAEVTLRLLQEREGQDLLRGPRPDPSVVLGAVAVLAVDAWRVRAALAAATVGGGEPGMVLDAAA